MSPLTVAEIVRLLEIEYGEATWTRRSDPLPELVQTILSQNTSDKNSGRAFDRLRAAFGSWDAVADADVAAIADAIQPGGLSRVKAPRIKSILESIRAERGSFDLEFLGEMPAGEALRWLRDLPGVGPKTAACVLLFSLGKPVLPVDTHVHRVAARLGLIDSRLPAERAHDVLGGMVPAADVYRFHILLIQHGRRTCLARRPRCDRCPLLPGCPTGRGLVGAVSEHGVKA